MNVQRLRAVADAIERRNDSQPKFSMARAAIELGQVNPPDTALADIGANTALSIEGWTCYLYKAECKLEKNLWPFYWGHGRDILELTDQQADSLFLGQWTATPAEEIAAPQAVQRLRGLANLEERRQIALLATETVQ